MATERNEEAIYRLLRDVVLDLELEILLPDERELFLAIQENRPEAMEKFRGLIGDLRVQILYLLFDLKVTREEKKSGHRRPRPSFGISEEEDDIPW